MTLDEYEEFLNQVAQAIEPIHTKWTLNHLGAGEFHDLVDTLDDFFQDKVELEEDDE